MIWFSLFVVFPLLVGLVLYILGTLSHWWVGRTPTYREVEEQWGWGKHGIDWEYDEHNRPRRK